MTPTTPDLAELRRLLDVNRGRDFHALPWHAWDRGIGYELHVGATCRDEMEPRGYCEEVNNGFRETFCAPEAELIVAAVNALPALLDAAAERDALTVAQPCVMMLGEVYDFAWCETHDRTFALGSSCDHAGLSHVDYLDDDGRKQRGRAVRAEMEMERIAAERDALAAKVERARALHFGEYVEDEDEDQNRCFECGDEWPCPTIRALDALDGRADS